MVKKAVIAGAILVAAGISVGGIWAIHKANHPGGFQPAVDEETARLHKAQVEAAERKAEVERLKAQLAALTAEGQKHLDSAGTMKAAVERQLADLEKAEVSAATREGAGTMPGR